MTLLTLLAPASPNVPTEDELLMIELYSSFRAIRNNSRSTAGDPVKRLRSNVGRADLEMKRLEQRLGLPRDP